MRILYLGDIVGRAAREAVMAALPGYRRSLALDFVMVNGENAAGGFGINAEITGQLLDAGADCVLTGNHVWDQREIVGHFQREPRLLRPANFPDGAPGRGIAAFDPADGRRVGVVHVMGRIFMEALDCPFAAADRAAGEMRLGHDVAALVVDVHAEATSEKIALAHHLDGRVSAVLGTHTHVPSADNRVLAGGTGFMTDVGMCGDYDSVIGMDKAEPINRFRTKVPGGRFTASLGPPTLCGCVIETDDATGLARSVSPLRQGAHLSPAWPEA